MIILSKNISWTLVRVLTFTFGTMPEENGWLSVRDVSIGVFLHICEIDAFGCHLKQIDLSCIDKLDNQIRSSDQVRELHFTIHFFVSVGLKDNETLCFLYQSKDAYYHIITHDYFYLVVSFSWYIKAPWLTSHAFVNLIIHFQKFIHQNKQ